MWIIRKSPKYSTRTDYRGTTGHRRHEKNKRERGGKCVLKVGEVVNKFTMYLTKEKEKKDRKIGKEERNSTSLLYAFFLDR
jgi:hypothetical protein